MVALAAILGVAVLTSRAANGDEPELDKIRGAVARAIPLLEAGARGSMEKRSNCFTCHNQGLPIVALQTARGHGFRIDDEHFQKQVAFVAAFLEKNRERFLEGKGTGGEIATAGTALWALEAGSWRPDETTAAVAEYLLLFAKSGKHWEMTSHRPPTEHSHFTANYLAIRGLQRYASDAQLARRDERIGQARQWLLGQSPQETEDRVFRLWALKLSNADAQEIATAREQLLATQREDGGWSQLDNQDPDAYATATALVALHQAAGVATDQAAYRRGLSFLLKSQLDDGSWRVVSRSKPFQTYFESGFPHGKDQFISITASAWAVTALSLACPPSHPSQEVALPPKKSEP